MAAKRLVRVVIDVGYVVDADDPDMVDHAKEAAYEDVMSAVKHGELWDWIKIVPAPDASEGDIPEFLITEDEPPRWVERHSVDCRTCGELVDERECVQGPGGEGSICPKCQKNEPEGGGE